MELHTPNDFQIRQSQESPPFLGGAVTGHSCVWVHDRSGNTQSPLRLLTGFLFCSHCARLVYNTFIFVSRINSFWEAGSGQISEITTLERKPALETPMGQNYDREI